MMNQETTGQDGFAGQQGITSGSSRYNALRFLIFQALGAIATTRVVKVVKVKNAGGVEPVGFVDVQPMVNQTDGVGNSTPHGTIFNVPYVRVQGGENAIIIDPVVGDIGVMMCSDRDISAVKQTKDQANPGSFRRFSLADGIYLGGLLNGNPKRYVRFYEDGIEVACETGKVTAKVGDNSISIDANGVAAVVAAGATASMACGANKVSVSSAGTTVDGPIIFNGAVTFLGGVNGAVSGGGTVNFGSANIQTSGSVKSGTVDLVTHHHLAPNGNTGPALP